MLCGKLAAAVMIGMSIVTTGDLGKAETTLPRTSPTRPSWTTTA